MREHRPVVVLADLPHGDQSLQVLVGLVGVDVVQRAAVPGVPVGGREVDGNLEARKKEKKKLYCHHTKWQNLSHSSELHWLIIKSLNSSKNKV